MHRFVWFVAGATAAMVGGELLYRLLEAIDPDDAVNGLRSPIGSGYSHR
jgi:hypothetical protein